MKQQDKKDMQNWARCWCSLCIYRSAEILLDVVLYYVPFYPPMKIILIAYLIFWKGGITLYNRFLSKLLNRLVKAQEKAKGSVRKILTPKKKKPDKKAWEDTFIPTNHPNLVHEITSRSD
mmetsp:Transcript_30610/g.59913  ORF Transcript_30610/g.59913 Transcript_30610/m.59913 type:complete len:120 (-) Transcript_30610:58-417(-)